ncbi:hypothetical protein P9112_006571 [Eukaryota sp. TZLM1-RC]
MEYVNPDWLAVGKRRRSGGVTGPKTFKLDVSDFLLPPFKVTTKEFPPSTTTESAMTSSPKNAHTSYSTSEAPLFSAPIFKQGASSSVPREGAATSPSYFTSQTQFPTSNMPQTSTITVPPTASTTSQPPVTPTSVPSFSFQSPSEKPKPQQKPKPKAEATQSSFSFSFPQTITEPDKPSVSPSRSPSPPALSASMKKSSGVKQFEPPPDVITQLENLSKSASDDVAKVNKAMSNVPLTEIRNHPQLVDLFSKKGIPLIINQVLANNSTRKAESVANSVSKGLAVVSDGHFNIEDVKRVFAIEIAKSVFQYASKHVRDADYSRSYHIALFVRDLINNPAFNSIKGMVNRFKMCLLTKFYSDEPLTIPLIITGRSAINHSLCYFYVAFLLVSADYSKLWSLLSGLSWLSLSNDYAGLFLSSCLKMSSWKLINIYKNQFKKLVLFVEEFVLPEIRKLKGSRPESMIISNSLSRVELFIEEFKQNPYQKDKGCNVSFG